VESAEQPVEIGEVLELHSPVSVRNQPREIRILQAAREAFGAWHILFVHTDAGGDADTAHLQRVEPARARVSAELGENGTRTVAVVPVRETEAWAIADGEALRATFGTLKSDADLGVPLRPRGVEAVADPKHALRDALVAAMGQRGARRERVAGMLELIGERVRLDILANIPAFSGVRTELFDVLKALHYLPGGGGAGGTEDSDC
jgi:hypothetical protein